MPDWQRLCGSPAIKRDIEDYRQALSSPESLEDRIYQDFVGGVLDRDGYQRQFKRVREERGRYTNLMEQAQLTISGAGMDVAKSILELATNAESQWKASTPAERRAFLDQLLSNPVLDGPTVRYEMKKPFGTLGAMKKDQDWRREVNNLELRLLLGRLRG